MAQTSSLTPSGSLVDPVLDAISRKLVTRDEFWRYYKEGRGKIRVLTVNLEILKMLLSDDTFLEKAHICTVDSAVLQKAMERRYRTIVDRITGREIVEYAANFLDDRTVLVFGATDESRRGAVRRFEALAPGSGLARGFAEPSEIYRSEQVPHDPSGRYAAFFAYGFPKQETRIDEFERLLEPDTDVVMIGVGGAIDYFSGDVPRPPDFITRHGFEWVWRLILQPSYRFRRMMGIVPVALRLKFLGLTR